MVSLSKTRKSDKQHLTYYALFGVYFISIIGAEAGLLTGICAHEDSGWATWQMLVAVLFSLVAILSLLSLWKQASKKIETLFLLVAAPLLVGFALFMMPFAVPDEFTHVNRVFDNRSGTMPLESPAQLLDAYKWIGSYTDLQKHFETAFDYSLVKETEFVAASYSELNYFFPSIAVAIGKFFGINGYTLIFVARLVNAALYLGACYWMLRTLPFGKKFAFVFLLNPLLLQQEASCSADALCNIGALCFIVQLIAMRFDERKHLPVRSWLILFALLIVAFVCKYVYLLLALSMIILYPRIKTKAIRIAIPFALVFGAIGAVFLVAAIGYGGYIVDTFGNFDLGIYFSKLFATVQFESLNLLRMFAGGNLGWPSMGGNSSPATVVVPVFWIFYLVTLGTAFVASFDKRCAFKRAERIFLTAVFLLECLLLYTALWGGDNQEGPVTILQGRYFIPPVFLGLFALISTRKNRLSEIGMVPFALAVVIINLGSLAFVIRWFW